jgi:glycosyltransferase involved in cell wall biosynthesis
MARIALLSPSITSGDAVSNDVLGMYRALQRRGCTTKIFAEGWSLDNLGILPFSRLSQYLKKPNDVLIYHYARGWEPSLEVLRDVRCQTVVRYHNVTPPEFFVRYSAELAAMCRAGRAQLAPIAQAGCDRYLSASTYNLGELIAEGAEAAASFVVPPFHHIEHLQTVAPDQEVLQRYADAKINVCMVGRVTPNKGHPALLEAFAAYHHDYNPNSRLLIVGKGETRLRNYARLLQEMVNRLKLKDAVVFTGEVSEAALKAYYQSAHAFMITSDHEGFCVPLVEAMSMNVPVIAYSSSAIPETVGDAGLVWAERNPYLLAESLHEMTIDESLRQRLGAKGRLRYEQQFTNEKIEAVFFSAMSEIL